MKTNRERCEMSMSSSSFIVCVSPFLSLSSPLVRWVADGVDVVGHTAISGWLVEHLLAGASAVAPSAHPHTH